jgi:hypothetical protein
MTANVLDLLSARRARQQPALTFDTDLEALEFAAKRLDELHERATTALLLDAESLRLQLGQAAAIVRACIRLHADRDEEDIR